MIAHGPSLIKEYREPVKKRMTCQGACGPMLFLDPNNNDTKNSRYVDKLLSCAPPHLQEQRKYMGVPASSKVIGGYASAAATTKQPTAWNMF
jgi:hypothetical protein